MGSNFEERDHVLYESLSNEPAQYNRPNPTPVSTQAKLDPALLKALKLFAKNHQQLEKAQDVCNRQRRVLSSDGRIANTNIPASTLEKSGGQIPNGPKFNNEAVEKQQSQICRTGPERSMERDIIPSQIKNEMLLFTKEGRQKLLNDLKGTTVNDGANKTFDKSRATQQDSIKRNTIKMPAKLAKSFLSTPKEQNNITVNRTARVNTQSKDPQSRPYNSSRRQQIRSNIVGDNYGKQNSQDNRQPNINQQESTNSANQNIIIHKPIVIQFQNKKITFVNQYKQQNQKQQRMYKSSNGRSPRNVPANNLSSFHESQLSHQNQLILPNNMVKNKSSKHQNSKGQVNSILQQILSLDNSQTQDAMEQDNSFSNASYGSSFQKKPHQQQGNPVTTFNLQALSKTEDSRASQKQNLNYGSKNLSNHEDNYSKQTQQNKQIINQLYQANNHQYKSQVRKGPQLLLNTLIEKQSRTSVNNTRKQTPQNCYATAVRESVDQLMTATTMQKRQIKRQQNHSNPTQLNNITKSLRSSQIDTQFHQEESRVFLPQGIDESFRICETLKQKSAARKSKKKIYQTNINSPAPEFDIQDKSMNQYQAYLISNQERSLIQKFQKINFNRLQHTKNLNLSKNGGAREKIF